MWFQGGACVGAVVPDFVLEVGVDLYCFFPALILSKYSKNSALGCWLRGARMRPGKACVQIEFHCSSSISSRK